MKKNIFIDNVIFIYLILFFLIFKASAQNINKEDSSVFLNSPATSIHHLFNIYNKQQQPVDKNKTNKNYYTKSFMQSSSVDVPDIPIVVSDTTQSENSVFISPLSKDVILNSNNSIYPPANWGNADYFMSTNGGNNWSGNLVGPTGNNRGDPATAIGRSDLNADGYGREFIGFMGDPNTTQKVAYSDNNGQTWYDVSVASCPFGCSLLDKNHLWIDNRLYKLDGTSNGLQGYLYDGWTVIRNDSDPCDHSIPEEQEIFISVSNANGISWSTPLNVSQSLANCINQGINIQTGSSGEVYACWSVYDSFTTGQYPEDAIGFNKSTNGGGTWGTATRIIDNIKGIRAPIGGELGGGKGMRTNSFPSMTVNLQNGHIFIVWTNRGVPCSSNNPPGCNTGDPDIYMLKSTDGGVTWNSTSPIRVNQDAIGNGKDQWFPWIACDEASNALVVVYYDSRNFVNNDSANTYVSISYDEGNTWTDFKISDSDWDGDGFLVTYAGDYIGVDVYHGKCVPVWSDDRSGVMLAYSNPFDVPCPQNLNLTYGNYYITDEISFSTDAAYKVSGSINVAGGTNTYKVYSGASTIMQAVNEVALNEGFESEGEFYAYTDPTCSTFSQKTENLPDGNSVNITDFPYASSNNGPFSVYPNPTTKDVFLIKNTREDRFKKAEISIYSSIGKLIEQHTNDFSVKPLMQINLSDKVKGFYLIKVVTMDNVRQEENIYYSKLILQ